MPIAFGSALGGLTTIIGTPPNLLVSAYRQEYTGHAFSLFDYSYVGIPIALFSLLFIVLIGWRFLPKKRKGTKREESLYQVHEYITEVKIPEKSRSIGLSILEFEEIIKGDFFLVGLIRNKNKRLILPPEQKLKAGDILIVEAPADELKELLRVAELELIPDKPFSTEWLQSSDVALMEAVVPENAYLEGRSSKEARLRARFHMNLLAIARQGSSLKHRINKTKLQAGDVVLVQGETKTLRENVIRTGLMPLGERDFRLTKQPRAYLPLFIFLIAIILTSLRLIPVDLAFGGAVLAMVIFRAFPARLLYSSIDWPIIILLAAMIPVGGALQSTGGTRLISSAFLAISAHTSPLIILGVLLFVTMTLSDFMNNAATTVVMAPIAISIAQALKLNIDPFLMAVSIGASCSFLTPIGHQNNLLVMGPGGYRFTDYLRLGIPIELIILALGTPLLAWMWPLHG